MNRLFSGWRQRRWVTSLAASLMLLLAMGPTAQAGVVDDFTVFQQAIDNNTAPGGVSDFSGIGASILGGQRDINADTIAVGSGATSTELTSTGVGQLDFSTDSLVTGTALVQWDGPDQDIALVPTGLGGIDFTESGTVGPISFQILFAQPVAGFRFTMEAYTDSGNYSIVEFQSPEVTSPETLSLPIGLFQNCGSAPVNLGVVNVLSVTCGGANNQPVDFTNLGALQLRINTGPVPTTSLDLTIAEITTVESLAALGDYVWEDNNSDGIQDGNEPGIDGATVNLYTCGGAFVDTTNTNASGAYLFTGLMPGSYYLEFVTPTGYDSPTLQDANGNTQDNVDSDAASFNGLTPCTDLVAGEVDNSWDAGFVPTPGPASLGDYVWNDTNGNGIQDVAEVGFAGVEVRLYICGNATAEANMFTDSTGFYQFTNLIPGNYFVEFIAPVGFDFTSQDQGANDAADSDANQLSGRTDCTELTSGENDLTWDAGLVEEQLPASLGNYVWEDTNANGIQDASESGIADITVNLYLCSNTSTTPDATMLTDGNGLYLFSSLAPGQYFVEFVKPAGFDFSSKDVGTDDAVDSDANQLTGRTDCTTLTSGENDLTWDAGLVPEAIPASLGNYVWEDTNANGIQDGVEVGIAGVEVRLYICGSATSETTMFTDANGFYQFTNLAAGSYYVEFVTPTGYVISQMDAGADDTVDSDVNPATGQTDCVQLMAGDNNDTVDAGMYLPASLGNFVWNDLNQDGIQDGGEPGIDGVTVRLLDCVGNVLSSAVTDANGFYEFTNLVPGGYVVEFVTPGMYTLSPQGQGVNTDLDSDAGGNGQTVCITLNSGENRSDIDAGMFIPTTAMLGDFVWEDLNADGIQNVGEPGIEGVTVNLFNCQGGFLGNTVTGVNGEYLFDNLLPGGYTVNVMVPAGYNISPRFQGADVATDSNIDASMNSECVTLAVGEVNRTIDAGLYRNASLGDRVWNDVNQDGIQDGNESGVSGITVNLYDCENNLLTSTTTDANGNYLFQGLMPGGYTVEFINQTGWVFSPANQGADEAVDSDAEQAGKTTCVTLASNETNLDVDAGIYLPPAPAIMIEKATNGHDADLPTGPSIAVGGAVEWTYVVTNTGNVMLTNITVSDDQGVDVTCPKTTLAVNEVMTCTANGTAIEGQYANVGSVTGTPPFGPNVSDTDPSHYYGELVVDCKPCEGKVTELMLEYQGTYAKKLKIVDKDGRVLFKDIVEPGQSFFFVGMDDKGTMTPEVRIFRWSKKYETWKLMQKIHTSCSEPIGPGAVFGKFEVLEATSRIGGPICPINAQCGLIIEKSASPDTIYVDGSTSYDGDSSYDGSSSYDSDSDSSYDGSSSYDGDSSGSGECPNGHEVVYTYLVSNTNSGALMNLMLSDDKLGQIMLPGTTLASNESVTVTETACISETTTNVALVTGKLVTGELCSATDSATVTVVAKEPCTDGDSSYDGDSSSDGDSDGDSSYSWSGGWGGHDGDSSYDGDSDSDSDGGACVNDGDSSYDGDSDSDSDSDSDNDSSYDGSSSYSWSGGWNW